MKKTNLIDELQLNSYLGSIMFSPSQDIDNESQASRNFEGSIEKPRKEYSQLNHHIKSYDELQNSFDSSKLAPQTPIDKIYRNKHSPQTNDISTRDNTVQKIALSIPSTTSKKATPTLLSQTNRSYDMTPLVEKSSISDQNSAIISEQSSQKKELAKSATPSPAGKMKLSAPSSVSGKKSTGKQYLPGCASDLNSEMEEALIDEMMEEYDLKNTDRKNNSPSSELQQQHHNQQSQKLEEQYKPPLSAVPEEETCSNNFTPLLEQSTIPDDDPPLFVTANGKTKFTFDKTKYLAAETLLDNADQDISYRPSLPHKLQREESQSNPKMIGFTNPKIFNHSQNAFIEVTKHKAQENQITYENQNSQGSFFGSQSSQASISRNKKIKVNSNSLKNALNKYGDEAAEKDDLTKRMTERVQQFSQKEKEEIESAIQSPQKSASSRMIDESVSSSKRGGQSTPIIKTGGHRIISVSRSKMLFAQKLFAESEDDGGISASHSPTMVNESKASMISSPLNKSSILNESNEKNNSSAIQDESQQSEEIENRFHKLESKSTKSTKDSGKLSNFQNINQRNIIEHQKKQSILSDSTITSQDLFKAGPSPKKPKAKAGKTSFMLKNSQPKHKQLQQQQGSFGFASAKQGAGQHSFNKIPSQRNNKSLQNFMLGFEDDDDDDDGGDVGNDEFENDTLDNNVQNDDQEHEEQNQDGATSTNNDAQHGTTENNNNNNNNNDTQKSVDGICGTFGSSTKNFIPSPKNTATPTTNSNKPTTQRSSTNQQNEGISFGFGFATAHNKKIEVKPELMSKFEGMLSQPNSQDLENDSFAEDASNQGETEVAKQASPAKEEKRAKESQGSNKNVQKATNNSASFSGFQTSGFGFGFANATNKKIEIKPELLSKFEGMLSQGGSQEVLDEVEQDQPQVKLSVPKDDVNFNSTADIDKELSNNSNFTSKSKLQDDNNSISKSNDNSIVNFSSIKSPSTIKDISNISQQPQLTKAPQSGKETPKILDSDDENSNNDSIKQTTKKFIKNDRRKLNASSKLSSTNLSHIVTNEVNNNNIGKTSNKNLLSNEPRKASGTQGSFKFTDKANEQTPMVSEENEALKQYEKVIKTTTNANTGNYKNFKKKAGNNKKGLKLNKTSDSMKRNFQEFEKDQTEVQDKPKILLNDGEMVDESKNKGSNETPKKLTTSTIFGDEKSPKPEKSFSQNPKIAGFRSKLHLVNGGSPRSNSYFYLENRRKGFEIQRNEERLSAWDCEGYKFCCPCVESFASQGGGEVENCFCNGELTMGWEQARHILLTRNFKQEYVTETWTKHHWRMIVWKLSSIQIKLKNYHSSKRLTFENVLNELEYRYFIEHNEGKRSALQKIIEKDEGANSHMVLLVGQITYSDTAYEVELSDGWNSVYLEIKNEKNYSLDSQQITNNQLLQYLIHSGRLAPGIKVHVCNLKVTKTVEVDTNQKNDNNKQTMLNENTTTNNDQQNAKPKTYVDVQYNSLARAQWDEKLGMQPSKNFPKSIKSIKPNGGLINMLDVFVIKKYKVLEKKGQMIKIFDNDYDAPVDPNTKLYFRIRVVDALTYYSQDKIQKYSSIYCDIEFQHQAPSFYSNIKEHERVRFYNLKPIPRKEKGFRYYDHMTTNVIHNSLHLQFNKNSLCRGISSFKAFKPELNEFKNFAKTQFPSVNFLSKVEFSSKEMVNFYSSQLKTFKNEVDVLGIILEADIQKAYGIMSNGNLFKVLTHSKPFFPNSKLLEKTNQIIMIRNVQVDDADKVPMEGCFAFSLRTTDNSSIQTTQLAQFKDETKPLDLIQKSKSEMESAKIKLDKLLKRYKYHQSSDSIDDDAIDQMLMEDEEIQKYLTTAEKEKEGEQNE